MALKTQFWKSAFVVFSNRVLTIYAVLLGLLGGIISVSWTLSAISKGDYLLGALSLGPWVTWPSHGTMDIDPYALALIDDNGDIPLGRGEGVVLKATKDTHGQKLSGSCRYTIGTDMPAARFWTLSFYNTRGEHLKTALQRTGFTSSEVLRDENGKFEIHAAATIQAGNWIQLEDKTHFEIILRFYDIPASLSANLQNADFLPSIIRKECTP